MFVLVWFAGQCSKSEHVGSRAAKGTGIQDRRTKLRIYDPLPGTTTRMLQRVVSRGDNWPNRSGKVLTSGGCYAGNSQLTGIGQCSALRPFLSPMAQDPRGNTLHRYQSHCFDVWRAPLPEKTIPARSDVFAAKTRVKPPTSARAFTALA